MAIWKNENLYVLETFHTTYAFFEDNDGILVHLYWGKRIDRKQDFDLITMEGEQGFHPNLDKKREECSSFGCMRYKETSMKLEFADGVRDFRYQLEKSEIEKNQLTIYLKDIYYSFEVLQMNSKCLFTMLSMKRKILLKSGERCAILEKNQCY